MTTEQMVSEIKSELLIELKDEENLDAELLEVKVRSVVREFLSRRRYKQAGYSVAMIEADIEDFFDIIKNIALVRYTKIGAEGQANYNADGESINYEKESIYWDGVYPLTRLS